MYLMDKYIEDSKKNINNIIEKIIKQLPLKYENITEDSLRKHINSILEIQTPFIQRCKGCKPNGMPCQYDAKNGTMYCKHHRMQDEKFKDNVTKNEEPIPCYYLECEFTGCYSLDNQMYCLRHYNKMKKISICSQRNCIYYNERFERCTKQSVGLFFTCNKKEHRDSEFSFRKEHNLKDFNSFIKSIDHSNITEKQSEILNLIESEY